MENETTLTRRGTPTIHVIADNIPQAHFRAMKAVLAHGYRMQTQYDRKNEAGIYIDNPSMDATVTIEVLDPLSEPRYPPISYCLIGAYIAEMFGVKDHLVVPMSILRRMIRAEDFTEEESALAKKWPYTYFQRLTQHPEISGDDFVNQIEEAIEAVAKTPFTRRAMMTTAVPNLDPYLTEDIPCLREIQLRCVEEDGILYLNPTTVWRSRDLFKAWGDNTIALTCLFQWMAKKIGIRMDREVRLGSYKDTSFSLHIYGQDLARACDALNGMDEKEYITRSMTSESAVEMRIIPDLENLLTYSEIHQWQFPGSAMTKINGLIEDFQAGRLI